MKLPTNKPDTYKTPEDNDDDNLYHTFCNCDEEESLCGKKKHPEDWKYPDKPVQDQERCIVCKQMKRNPCYRCRED